MEVDTGVWVAEEGYHAGGKERGWIKVKGYIFHPMVSKLDLTSARTLADPPHSKLHNVG